MEGRLEKINNDTKKAEATLTQMEKCCGLCLCTCRNRKPFELSATYRKAKFGTTNDVPMQELGKDKASGKGKDSASGHAGVTRGEQKPTGGASASTPASGSQPQQFVPRITNDAREDEMDQNLGVVSEMLQDMRGQAEEMNVALSQQNKQLDRIAAKTDSDTARVASATKRTVALL